MQSVVVESFNRRLRRECLDDKPFAKFAEARQIIKVGGPTTASTDSRHRWMDTLETKSPKSYVLSDRPRLLSANAALSRS